MSANAIRIKRASRYGREVLWATRQPPGLRIPRERFGGHPAGYYATIGTSTQALVHLVGAGRRFALGAPEAALAIQSPAPAAQPRPARMARAGRILCAAEDALVHARGPACR